MPCAILVRQPRDDMDVDAFLGAARPDEAFDVPVTVITGLAVDGPRRIVPVGLAGAPREALAGTIERFAASGQARHERIAAVIAAAHGGAICGIVDETDLEPPR